MRVKMYVAQFPEFIGKHPIFPYKPRMGEIVKPRERRKEDIAGLYVRDKYWQWKHHPKG